MVIGQDILVSAINDNAGAETIFNILSFAGFEKIPEEPVKEIVIFPREKGVEISLHQLAGANVDNSGAYFPDSSYYSILPGKDLVCPA